MKAALYKELITHFCQVTGFDTPESVLAAGEVLVDDIAIALGFEPAIAGEELILYSDIALRPARVDTGLLTHLLEANMLWSGTNGATIGMHPESGRIGLALRLAVSQPDGHWLVQALYHFANVTRQWREYVANYQYNVPQHFVYQ